MDQASEKRKIAIIGAGIIGLAVGRRLQKRGHDVTLIDPEDPASQCSSGNGGHIASEQVTPLARPATLTRVLAMLMDPLAPLTIQWRDLPALLPWFLRFVWAARPRQFHRGTEAIARLTQRAGGAWLDLAESDDLKDYIRFDGCTTIYESKASWKRAQKEFELQRKHGVDVQIMSQEELAARVPGLRMDIEYAVFHPNSGQVSDPEALGRAIAQRIIADSGRFHKAAATGFIAKSGTIRAVKTTKGDIAADEVIIAAGVHSRVFAGQLGFRAPLTPERGYHLMLDCPKTPLRQPVIANDRALILNPMRHGLRIAGTIEFARLEREATKKRAKRLLTHAQELFPKHEFSRKSCWMGNRPSLPDFVPAIGRAPGHDNVWCAYGHQHLGLTLATVTAEILDDLMHGGKPDYPVDAFDPGRW